MKHFVDQTEQRVPRILERRGVILCRGEEFSSHEEAEEVWGPARSRSHGLPQERCGGKPMSGGPGGSRVAAAANLEKMKVSPEKHRQTSSGKI